MANEYPRKIRLRGMLAKPESTYGTDPTPSASTDGVRVKGTLRPRPEWAFPNKREDVVTGNTIGMAPPGIPAGLFVQLEVEVELTGAGSAYSASVLPQAHALLMGCGFGNAIVTTGGSESSTYTLADTGHGSCTIWAYGENGKLYKVNGCRGTVEWPITAGQLGTLKFTMSGFMAAPATGVTEADLASITYDSVKPPPATGLALAIANSTDTWDPPRFQTASVRTGGNVVRLDDASDATNGIEMFAIPDFDPQFEITARIPTLGDYDFVVASGYNAANPPLPHTIDLTYGSTQYNRCSLDINVAYLDAYPDPGDDNGFATGTFVFKANDLALVFN